MCANGYYFDFFIWAQDNSSSNNCPTTVIDRNKPVIGAASTARHAHEEPAAEPVHRLRGRHQPAVVRLERPRVELDVHQPRRAVHPGRQARRRTAASRNARTRGSTGSTARPTSAPSATARGTSAPMAADAAMPGNVAPGVGRHVELRQPVGRLLRSRHARPRGAGRSRVNSSTTTATVGELVSFSASATDPAGVRPVRLGLRHNAGDRLRRGDDAHLHDPGHLPGAGPHLRWRWATRARRRARSRSTPPRTVVAGQRLRRTPAVAVAGPRLRRTPAAAVAAAGPTPPPNDGGGTTTPPDKAARRTLATVARRPRRARRTARTGAQPEPAAGQRCARRADGRAAADRRPTSSAAWASSRRRR